LLIVVIIVNAVFSFAQEYASEKLMESFHKMMPASIEGLRDGIRTRIPYQEIVPGDIIFLEEGDKVPADGRLITENDLKVDHSSLTGESEPQLRSLEWTHENMLLSRNMVFAGTLVQSGDGIALIFQTGMETQIGKIAEITKLTKLRVPHLRKEINRFIRTISTISLILSSVFLIIGLMIGNGLILSLIFAIGILVANIPEGLLPTTTLCLRIAAKRMAKRHALIKRLESVETLGATTVICTDKTGTITENQASVNTLFLNREERSVFESEFDQLPGLKELLKICTLCNNARKTPKGELRGASVDCALLTFANKHDHIDSVLEKNLRSLELPFDSIKRRMITVHNLEDQKTAYLKGAPEEVLNSCSRILYNGAIIGLSEEEKTQILHHDKKFASRGERVMGFAFRDHFTGEEEGFIFVALIGMLDRPRKDVHHAIAKCQKAGIKVIMITGDSSITAKAIGVMVGLVKGEQTKIMTGEELNTCSDEALKEFLSLEHLIFSRTSPLQKLRIVKALQSMQEIVTVTGDGVNDAPALKQADLGVAMGLAGTEVAKEASDMILMDDHFATIVNAVEEGRTLFDNIKKFIGYILTHLVPEILPFVAFAVFDLPIPLTVVLILCIDLGTDILPAVGLGVEIPEKGVMNRPPQKQNGKLLTPSLLIRSYCVLGMIEAMAGFFSYFVILYSNGWKWGQSLASTNLLYQRATTAFFVSIVFCQIANVLVNRTELESIFKKGLFSNRMVVAGILSELVIVWLVMTQPLLQDFFKTQPLSWFELSLSIPFALFIVFIEEVRKAVLRKKNGSKVKNAL
jgi:sodium/potassium-transporting ATPase subunit alpha